MQSVLLDAADHRRSPATMPGYHRGRPPGNKGELYPADPPTVEEVVAVMRTVGDHPHGERLRALTALHRGELDQARAVIAAFDADCEAAFESDYRSLREVALAHLASAPLEAKAVVDHAQSGDYAEWPTWLSLAVDLLPQLPDDELLRDTLGTLQAGIAPQTSPIVAAQSARLEALLASRSGDAALAAASWAASIAAAADAGMVFDVATLSLERFEHTPDSPDAPAGLRRAVETFTGLRAAPWLERARFAAQVAPTSS